MKILFAASEAFPFIKTGGLGDVVHSLPLALKQLGHDVRLVLPAYRDVLAGVESPTELGSWMIPGMKRSHKVILLQAHQNELGDYLYLINIPALFDRPGNPYVHEEGHDWPDNAERFTVFSRAVAEMARDLPGKKWLPDVIHCHDWQTGLVPAFLSLQQPRPATVFTIHNLAYDGHFSQQNFIDLGLPASWWSVEYVEFYGGLSMLKAGMVFADRVTTVSPTYAKEICTPKFGYRYEGILRSLGTKLSGILNGIDLTIWNPETDTYLAKNYSAKKQCTAGKAKNKQFLLNRAGFNKTADKTAPLMGFIGRLVEQKGIDMIIRTAPVLFETSNVNMVILGSGHMAYEAEIQQLAEDYPGRLYVHIGYSEELAHQIEAGCDIFLMPSRFEPCGLNQMYSLRYGTLPVVHHTGGLADTVTDAQIDTIKNKTATGFVFYHETDEALREAIQRALVLYTQSSVWKQLCHTAMLSPLGWERSAAEYLKLYRLSMASVAK